MLETFVNYLSGMPWYLILISAMLITFLENIFPPSPSDSALIFIGTLAGIGAVDLIPLLITSTLGSLFGFMMMFFLGKLVGHRVIKSKKFFFITQKRIEQPKRWLKKYGYYIIAVNRFMSGTRGLISFLAGMAEMNTAPTFTLAGISALIWNFILIYLGMVLGQNWRLANEYIHSYGKFILIIIISLALIFLLRYIYIKKFKKVS